MKLLGKEHYDLIASFDSNFNHMRLDKEDKSMWAKGCVYQSGETNNAFLAYRLGYSLGKVVERERDFAS